MKILFFSDVHGSPESMTLLLDRIKRFAPDHLALLGDALYHGPRNPLRPDYAPPVVVTQLNSLKSRITAVRGNCDSEVDQMLLEFPIMAEYSTLLAAGRRFFLTHGHHWNPGNPPPLEPGDVLVCGHTHIPLLEREPGGIIAFNPGSISLPKGGFVPTYGVLDHDVLRVCALENGEIQMEMALNG